jgi:hypothetical protein
MVPHGPLLRQMAMTLFIPETLEHSRGLALSSLRLRRVCSGLATLGDIHLRNTLLSWLRRDKERLPEGSPRPAVRVEQRTPSHRL